MNELSPNVSPLNPHLGVDNSYPLAHQQELKEKITIVAKRVKWSEIDDGPAYEIKLNVKVASKEGGTILDLGELKAVSRSWVNVIKETILVSSSPLIALGCMWVFSVLAFPFLPFAIIATPFLLAAFPVVATGMIVTEIGKGVFYRLSNDQKKIEIGGNEYYVSGKEYQRFLDTMNPADGNLPANEAEGQDNVVLAEDAKVKTNEFQLLIKNKTIAYLDNVFHNAAQSPVELNEKLKKALENYDQAAAKELFILGADPNRWFTVEQKATGIVTTGSLYTHAYVNGWSELRSLMNEAEHVRDKVFMQSRCFKQTFPDINPNSPITTVEMPTSGFSGSDEYLQRIARAVGTNDPKKIKGILSEYMAVQKAVFLAKMQEFRDDYPEANIKAFRKRLVTQQQKEAHDLFAKRFVYKKGKGEGYVSSNLHSVIYDLKKGAKWRQMDGFRSKFYKNFQMGTFHSNYLVHPYHCGRSNKKDYESFVHQKGEMDERKKKIVSCFVNPALSKGAKDFLTLIKGIDKDELDDLLSAEITISALRNIAELKSVKEAVGNGNHTIFNTDITYEEGEKGSLYAHLVKKWRDPETHAFWMPIYEELHKGGLNRHGPFELTCHKMQYYQFPEDE